MVDDSALRRLAVITPTVIFVQIMVGATMRHTGAGLAIPDFPLAFGRLIPPMWDSGIAVHFAHRVGAVVVVALVVALSAHVLAHHRTQKELARPAALLLLLVVVQFGLGAWTVLSERQVAVNTAHVGTGALLFVTAVVMGLRVHREQFADAAQPNPAAVAGSAVSSALTPQGSPGAGA